MKSSRGFELPLWTSYLVHFLLYPAEPKEVKTETVRPKRTFHEAQDVCTLSTGNVWPFLNCKVAPGQSGAM